MISYLFPAAKTCLLFGYRLLRSIPAEGWRHAPKRALLFLLLWMTFIALTVIHLVGFLLDDILFHDFRQVKVRQPVFIIGTPRSGTTFLQRVLAHDTDFTTFTTWEALFAPSVTERIVYGFTGKLLKPLRHLALSMRQRFLGRMDTIHHLALNAPEEDFLLLIWINACLLQAFLCPGEKSYWQLGQFDENVGQHDATRILAWYKKCLQRHLYYHGKDKRILSKNPSFTSMTTSLQHAFPDANFVICYRDPLEVVPSQLSSLRPAMTLLGSGQLAPHVQEKLIELLVVYYGLLKQWDNHPDFFFVPMFALTESLSNTVESLYSHINKMPDNAFRNTLAREQEKSRAYKSRHRYVLAEFGLEDSDIRARFANVWPLRLENNPEST